MPRSKKLPKHRLPVQARARVTVESMLDASIKLLKRGGPASLTTNRIAEMAGVSIGSVYQYFPNKQAIYRALHQRHIARVDQVLQYYIREVEEGSLTSLVSSMFDGMIEVHRCDPELSDLLQSEVPHRADGTADFTMRYLATFRRALGASHEKRSRGSDLTMKSFIALKMIDSLGHAIVLQRPAGFSLSKARAEAIRAVDAYLQL